MRALIAFCRVPTWRRHVQRALALDDEGLDLRILDHFDVNIAKWRYETIAVVSAKLAEYMPLLQRVPAALFANSQDKEMLRSAFDAINDSDLGDFLPTVSREVFGMLEKDRHWGMICECDNHVQLRRSREG